LESVRRQLAARQEDIATKIGVSIKTYQRYEAGTQELKIGHLGALRDLGSIFGMGRFWILRSNRMTSARHR